MLTSIKKSLLLTALFSLLTFSNVLANDFYWVGNSGVWNDASHWAAKSGGKGGVGIPSQNDNVFFDKKSFKKESSIVAQGSVFCKNFYWTNTKNVAFKSQIDAQLTVNGSFSVNEFYVNKFHGTTVFTSNQLNTELFFDRSEFLGDVEFNGIGSWFLKSNLITADSNYINLIKGEVIANNITVFTGGVDVSGSFSKKITATNAVIYAHKKMILNNAPNFSFMRSNTSVILNKKIMNQNLQLGSFDVNNFVFSQKSAMKNTCGAVALTVTLTVLSDYNGFGESCVGNCDGTVFVTYTGGVGPFTTEWSTSDANDGATTDTIYNVCSGNVGVNITDLGQPTPPFGSLQCSETIQVDAPVPLLVALLGSVEPTCNGDTDGALGVDISFGVPFPGSPGYIISWTNTAQITEIITGLGANTYTISIEDANGCTLDSAFVLTEPPVITFTLNSTNIDCFGACSGDAAVSNVLGGNGPPFTFLWSNPPGGNTNSISNVCIGTYVVTVSDDSLCFTKDSVTITQNPQMQIDTATTATTCGGGCDGTITSTVLSGGTAPYTHHWSNGVVFTGNVSTISGLCAGNYCDTIVDGNGCDTIFCFVVLEPDTVKTNSIVSNVVCNGDCDGTIITIPTGGTSNYTFVWDSIPTGGVFSGQGTDSVFALCPGTYVATIMDDNGCTVSDTISVSEPPLLLANPTFTDITCFGFNDGTATANPTGGTGDPVVDFSYSWSGPSCSPCLTQSIGSLSAGTYIVTVTDSAGCTAIDSVVITEPTPLILTSTVTSETCPGACDGTAGITATGGTPTYTYLWTASPIQPFSGQGTDSVFDLCAGDYTVVVTDFLGCLSNNTVTVNPAPPIVDNLITTNITCNGVCNGTATISPTGGLAPYTVSWNGAVSAGNILMGGSETIIGLCIIPNPHTALITDANGCTLLVNFVITEPPLLTTTTTLNDVSCFGLCDGNANTNPLGGVAPYTFVWTPNPGAANGQGTDSVFNLCVGEYIVTVTDDSLCTVNDTITIIEPLEIFPNVDSTNITCNGLDDGTATSLPTGGVPGYSFGWVGPGAFSSNNQTIGPLSPGQYTVTVTDTNGCVGLETINITEPQSIVVSTNTTGTTCGGMCDGTIASTVLSGGTAPYTHHWSNGVVFTGNVSTVSGLCAGNYCDTIVDANGCDTIFCFVVLEPDTVKTNSIVSDVVCNGDCDGTIITIPTGGTPNYTFVWDSIPTGGVFSGQGTDSIFALCPGTYVVTIMDDNGCTVSDTISVTEPPLLLANPTFTDITCFGFNDGTATTNPTGGTGDPVVDFSYSWSGPSCSPCLTQSIGSLSAGTYIVTVTDSVGCTAIDSVVITEPTPLILTSTITNETCPGACDGTAVIFATGGTPTYTYLWAASPIQPFSGQGTDSVFDLCAGDYTVVVTDFLGCSSNNTVTVNPAAPIVDNLITTNITCNGVCNGTATISPTGGLAPYTVSWNGAVSAGNILLGGSETITGLCIIPNPHTALITDANGCTLLVNFVITEPPLLTTTTTLNDVSCFGLCDGNANTNPLGGVAPYTFVWTPNPGAANGQGTDSVFNLCVGQYIVTVTDDSLCTVNDTITIIEPLEIFPNVDSTNITCNGLDDGTAISLPTGGVPGYSFGWVGPGGFSSTNQAIGPLPPGQYTVTVTDTNGCTGLETVNIIDPQLITVDVNATAASCGAICDGSALVVVNGGTPGYTYDIGNGPQLSPTFTGLCEGIYTVTVIDTNGCTASDTTVINPLITITINPTIIGISCNGVCDGTATVFPIGGTLPYTYLWDAPLPNTDSIVTGLCSGFITITVTDALGCITTDSVNMPVDPTVLQTGATLVQPVSCANVCDAMVAHSPSGGVLPYTSVWTLPFGNDTNNVCPTSAIITVTDGNNCVQSDTIFIENPTPIVPNDVVVNVVCFGDSTGSITLNPTGGTGGVYNYVWTGPVIGSGMSTNNLPAGIYTITVTDSNGCFVIVTDTITELPILSANPIAVNISCNGLCDGVMAVTVNGGTSPYTYSWGNNQPVPPAAQDTLFNVCAPFLTNSVTVQDDNGCSLPAITITITEPAVLNANVSGTSISCDGTCSGTALSSPTGGTAPYQFLWSANAIPNNLNNSNISNLCVGNYLITVTDTNGCVDTSTYSVVAPPLLNVTLDSTNVICNGDNNGVVTATIVSGTAPFTFSWVGGCIVGSNNNPSVSNLCPGIYTVTVTDSNNCVFIGSINVVEPQPIVDSTVVVDANCGLNDGSITMFASGGTPPYTHSWSNGVSGPSNTGLSAGFYTDTITDFRGCIAIFTIAVTNPTGPSGITATVNDAQCFGSCDGSLNVIVIGGTSPYTYAWTGPGGYIGTNDSTQTGLCAGTYNLTLTETSTGCILASSIIIGEADSISANSSFTNASCNGVCDGTANVTPTGGTAPYTYLWSHNGSTASSASGLCVGAVNVTITDFNNCTKVVSFNIASPNLLVVSSNQINPLCNQSCDGTATANPVGGTASYSFQWNDPLAQTTQTATGLCAGTYIVTVTDFNGCSVNDTVIIIDPTNITDNAVTTNSTCGNSDGTATVLASAGGTGIHTYNWTSLGVTTSAVSGLAAGTYPVVICDVNLCCDTFLIAVSDVNGPTVTVNSLNTTCNGVCDGQATATANGTANFSYLWQTGGQTTPTITGLCAGNYTVEVTDGNSCITTEAVIISDNSSINATVTIADVTCNGLCNGYALVVPNGGVPPYNYSWTGGSAVGQTINAVGGLCAGNYTVTITDFVGCSFIQNITITEPNVLVAPVSGIDANCNGSCDGSATVNPAGGTAPYTYLWSNGASTPTITALCAGSYSVIVTDSNGCTANSSVVIGDGIPITATITKVDVTGSAVFCTLCDGSITVSNIAGGSGAPYTLLWAVNGLTTPTINNLCPGAYSLTITDNAGCTQIFNVLINNQNGQASLNTQANDVSCFGSCDGLAFTTPIGGLAPVALFQWDDPNLTTNDTATALCAGFYTVIMQDDFGCITVDSVTVFEPQKIVTNLTSTPPTCPGICDGTTTVTPTDGVGAYTVSWDGAAAINVAIGGSNTITGLCAGVHTVLVTDANNCSVIDSITIIDPTAINITISSTSPTCFGDCDGIVIANANGGNPGYQYSWNTNPVQNNSLIGGLCATAPNFVVVTITDNSNCIVKDSVQIINPPLLTTLSTPNLASCNGVCDGSITTSPTGGVAPYTYIWSNGDTTQTTSTTLCAGSYVVTVVDANNCTVIDTVILVDPAILDAAISPISPDCGICNGSITSTPLGGTGPFNFVWTNPSASSPLIQTDLGVATSTIIAQCAGTYNLQITDQGTGCVSDYTVILNSTNGPTLVMTATDETCLSACDGTATVMTNGGTAPFTYSWIPTSPLDTNQTAIGLCVGQYVVTVTDSNQCVISDTISIATNGLSLSITSVVPETCFGNCDGSVTVLVSGGVPTYNYNWSPTSQVTPQAINLCSGSYVVTVTDSINCSDSISANITSPNILTVVAIVNTPITCNGATTGVAIANVLGGTPNYQFSWDDPLNQTTQIASGLSAGVYIVTVIDDNGCTATDTITITEPLAILANESVNNPACGVCDGVIAIAPTGGTAPYSFLWTTPTSPPDPQPVTATIINLCAGAYALVITDSTGCEANFNFPLSNINAPIPNTTATNISCNGFCDGAISSAVTGGTTPYTYLWSPSGSTSPNITGLCVDQYTLSVTDSLGCVGVEINDITEPAVLLANVSATNISCNGVCDGVAVSNPIGGTSPYTYNWMPGNLTTDSINNLCGNTYTVVVTDSNNCTVTDSATIIEPTLITSTSTQQDVTCTSNCDGSATVTAADGTGPYTYQWNGNITPGQSNTQIGLCLGINTIIITDQNGCTITHTISLGAIDTILADAGLDTNVCLGTPVSLNGTPSGAFTNVEWFELPSMNSLGITDTVIVTSSAVGVVCYAYSVTGTCVVTDTVCITTSPLPIADAGPDVSILENGNATLNATGGISYSWTPSIWLSDTAIFNPVTTPEETITYFVTVTSVNGCVATDSVIVTVLPSVDFPDGITPNGDGKNDVWIIDLIDEFPENVVEIYNRWGELLFHADGYQQDWDGTYNGKELPIGTYYYVIDLHDDLIKPFTGPITILR